MGRNSEYVHVMSGTLLPDQRIFTQPSPHQIAEKRRQIATRLGKTGFTGSNGWLEKWKSCYNIKRGESGNVDRTTIDSWKERLPELLQGYKKKDIMNLYKT